MPSLAEAGYAVVAFDQRGYGRTTGWDTSPFPETDMSQFTLTTIVRDAVTLVHALGYREVKCIVGHDFGAVTASKCALMRPDLFRSVVMMSHPFKAPASLPFNIAHGQGDVQPPPIDIQTELAKLPEPRKHYKWYNSTEDAAREWATPAQGLCDFLRGYLHVKSADWKQNKPYPLEEWSALQLAKMPHYYIMPLEKSMPETIATMMATEDADATKKWMSDEDLDVYVQEWSRTGFQGGLNFYRTTTDPDKQHDLDLFAGKKIECPSTFISGASDWGNYQEPGAIEAFPQVLLGFPRHQARRRRGTLAAAGAASKGFRRDFELSPVLVSVRLSGHIYIYAAWFSKVLAPCLLPTFQRVLDPIGEVHLTPKVLLTLTYFWRFRIPLVITHIFAGTHFDINWRY